MSPIQASEHTFHIPVMGTGFTLDTPLKVARFGISSVVSLVDDILIDQMRHVICARHAEPCETIDPSDPDARAKRITAYLNLLDKLVTQQVERLRQEPFSATSEITRYFQMMPDGSAKTLYERMLTADDEQAKSAMQARLREMVTPGSIDVNIMTKLDCVPYSGGKPLDAIYSDAMQALRGFAVSSLRSAMVFSAGINPSLYGYMTQFEDFVADENGHSRKSIIVKVSDYRSATIQGKYLARHGLWVSEFRIESGLNCGGHAFATAGVLLGQVLEQFRTKKDALKETMLKAYNHGRAQRGLAPVAGAPPLRITAQGGIGTPDEHRVMLDAFNVDAVGWGTPFLLAPDVVNMDDDHIERLLKLRREEVYLSSASPLNIPFWNVRTCDSEMARERRIAEGKPGSKCVKHFLEFNTEFTRRPICTASSTYQKLKLAALRAQGLPEDELAKQSAEVVKKSCLCHDLGGSLKRKYDLDPEATPAICAGPGIAYFKEKVNLWRMIDHIYGRIRLPLDENRPHVLIEELRLYVEHFRSQVEQITSSEAPARLKYLSDYADSLMQGIAFYRERCMDLARHMADGFMEHLKELEAEVTGLLPVSVFV